MVNMDFVATFQLWIWDERVTEQLKLDRSLGGPRSSPAAAGSGLRSDGATQGCVPLGLEIP